MAQDMFNLNKCCLNISIAAKLEPVLILEMILVNIRASYMPLLGEHRIVFSVLNSNEWTRYVICHSWLGDGLCYVLHDT